MSAASPDTPVRLGAIPDAALIARIFRAAGRVHIPGIFHPVTAQRIHAALANETPWQLAYNDGKADRDLAAESLQALDAGQREALLRETDRAAEHGFCYRYANFRMFENYQAGQHRELYLMRVLEFLNSPPLRDLMRQVCGDPSIAFADGQATLYRAGDFLTQHDDEVEGKGRRVAYVLNFTPEWRADWGGLLAFPDAQGHVAEAYVPTFNALNLLRVPAPHLVTQVASYVRAGRYSITGWLRALPAG